MRNVSLHQDFLLALVGEGAGEGDLMKVSMASVVSDFKEKLEIKGLPFFSKCHASQPPRSRSVRGLGGN